MTQDATYWNGYPCEARRVRVIVGDASFPKYWARQFVGQERDAVEVTAAVGAEGTFYLDNQDGSGWTKVTEGQGSSQYPHRNLAISDIVEERDAPVRPPAPDRKVQAT